MVKTMQLIYKGMAVVFLLFGLGLVLNSCAADGSGSTKTAALEKPPSPEDVFTF